MATHPRRIVEESHCNMKQLSEVQTLRVRFHNYHDLSKKVGCYHLSESMHCLGHNWKIGVYPGGRKEKHSKYVSIGLYLVDAVDEALKVVLGIRVGERYWNTDRSRPFCKEQFGYCSSRFIRQDNIDFYLEDGTLVVEVDVQIYQPISLPGKVSFFIPESNSVGKDMLQMLEEGKHSDVTVRVGGEIFPIHQSIVACRSPGLMEELVDVLTEEKEWDIPNVDPQLFRTFLRFVYGDEIPTDLPDHAVEMLKLADRFGCPKLKLYAEAEIVQSGITADTAADLILLAESHSCALLKEAATDFFVAYPKRVMASKGWSKVEESTAILSELMKYLAGMDSAAAAGSETGHDDDDDDDDEENIDKMRVVPLRRKLSELGLCVDGSREMLVKRLKTSTDSSSEE